MSRHRRTRWILDAIRRDLRTPNDPVYYLVSFVVFAAAVAVFVSGGHIGWAIFTGAGAVLCGWIVVRELRRRRTRSPGQ